MAVVNWRTIVANTRIKGRRATSGHYSAIYRNAKGNTFGAKVIGPGTASGLKIRTSAGVLDNVAAITALGQTGVYVAREG